MAAAFKTQRGPGGIASKNLGHYGDGRQVSRMDTWSTTFQGKGFFTLWRQNELSLSLECVESFGTRQVR